MGNWKEKLGERIVGDCFGGFASYMSSVDSTKPSNAYTKEIREKFLFATSRKSKPLVRNDKRVVSNDVGLTNKIIGVSG